MGTQPRRYRKMVRQNSLFVGVPLKGRVKVSKVKLSAAGVEGKTPELRAERPSAIVAGIAENVSRGVEQH